MNLSFVPTKVSNPLKNRKGLPRESIQKEIHQALDRGVKLILISSWAGSGKTQLLNQLSFQEGFKTCWLTLDESDDKLIRFWLYLIYSIQQKIPDFCLDYQDHFAGMLGDDPDPIIEILIQRLHQLKTPLVMILDDFHHIKDKIIHKSFQRFVDYLPANVHLILSTRETPPLGLSEMESKETLLRIGIQELCFSMEEGKTFLKEKHGVILSQASLQSLHQKLEGWPAGFQILGIKLRKMEESKRSTYIANLKGRNEPIRDYLMDVFVNDLSTEERDFCTKVSIFDVFSPEISKELTGRSDCREMIGRLYRKNGFLYPVNYHEEEFRLHPLVREILEKEFRKDPQDFTTYVKTGASLLENQGKPMDAMNLLYTLEDKKAAAIFLERHVLSLFYGNQLHLLKEWLIPLDEKIIKESPLLSAVYAGYVFLKESQHSQGQDISPMVMKWIGYSDKAIRKKEKKRQILWDRQAHFFNRKLECYLDLYQDKSSEEGIQRCRALLQELPDEEKWFRSALHHNLGVNYYRQGKWQESHSQFRRTIHLGKLCGDRFNMASAYFYLSTIQYHSGYLEKASLICQEGLTASENQGGLIPYSGILFLILAQIKGENGRFQEAIDLIAKSKSLLIMGGMETSLDWMGLLYSEILWICGDEMQAKDRLRPLLKKSEMLPMDFQFRLLPFLESKYPIPDFAERLKIQRDPVPSAEAMEFGNRWKELHRLGIEAFYFPKDFTYEGLRKACFLGNELLKENVSYNLVALKILLEHSISQGAEERAKGIWAEMRQESKGSYILSRAIGSSKYRSWVKKYQKEGIDQDPLFQKWLFSPKLEKVSSLSLTPREQEILELICQGKDNPEIAEALFISLSTVKTHINRIFSKMNVKNRSQAILKASKST